jgi:hypothetical protein
MENKTLQPDLESIEKSIDKEKQLFTNSMFHMPTPRKSNKLRGVGITRKNKSETKEKKKSAKLQRATNRKMANKKSRPTGSKKRK